MSSNRATIEVFVRPFIFHKVSRQPAEIQKPYYDTAEAEGKGPEGHEHRTEPGVRGKQNRAFRRPTLLQTGCEQRLGSFSDPAWTPLAIFLTEVKSMTLSIRSYPPQ